MTPAPFDVQRAHRWFAVELNNLAWDTVEASDRTDEQTELMLHAAHAACYHWLQVGDLLNHLRAQCLLTTAYACAGHAEAALRHAVKCLELSEQAGEEQSDWDLATTYACAAKAYQIAQLTDHAAAMQAQAQAVAATFEDEDDKALFERLYGGS
jgi:hypothetical protein